MKKSYELAYDKFIEACGKWADLYYAHHSDYDKPASGRVGEDGSDRQATYCRWSEQESETRKLLSRYVSLRLEHEAKHGKAK